MILLTIAPPALSLPAPFRLQTPALRLLGPCGLHAAHRLLHVRGRERVRGGLLRQRGIAPRDVPRATELVLVSCLAGAEDLALGQERVLQRALRGG